MRILLVEPKKVPCEKDIEDSLRSMQKSVNGNIEVIYPFKDNVALVCGAVSKFNGSPLNRELVECGDIICDTFFICGTNEDKLTSLSDELFEKYYERFKFPEEFITLNHEFKAIKMPAITNHPSSNNLIDANGYTLLNDIPIMFCDKRTGLNHNKEIDDFINYLGSNECFQKSLIVKKMDVDIASSNNKIEHFIYEDWNSLVASLNDYDLKNGMDFGVSSDKGLVIAMYGGEYSYENINDYKKTLLEIHPIHCLEKENIEIPQSYYNFFNKDNDDVKQVLLKMKNEAASKKKRSKYNDFERSV